jgi:hypothetical protein
MSKRHSPLDFLDDALGAVRYSAHGRERAAQRGLSEFDLRYVLMHGSWVRRTGVDIVCLRSRDIPAGDRPVDAIARLVGTVVLLGDDACVITAYQNHLATRAIRKKRKARDRLAPAPIHRFDPQWAVQPATQATIRRVPQDASR